MITHQSQLVGGQHYIRVVINCHGKTWLEVYRVLGKPYVQRASEYTNKNNKVSTIASHRHAKIESSYLSTLGIENNRQIQNVACFRFSNKLYNKLSGMLSRRADLLAFINKRKLTDVELVGMVDDWDFQIWQDEGYAEILSEELSIKPIEHTKTYLSDPTLQDAISKSHLTRGIDSLQFDLSKVTW